MNHKIIWRDLSKNTVVSITTALFITTAAMLLSLAAVLAVHLLGSIDQLMETAKTPHFMQMHTGEVNMEQIGRFAEEDPRMEQYQVLEFLNVENEKIVINGSSLAGNVQDNGFSTQSKKFDFLLNLENKPVNPHNGEIYVPICYYRNQTAKLGDSVLIGENAFVVAGFIRDSQMNSSLASSKRFLVSEGDYERLKSSGTVEYLIEFRLEDLSELGEFEAAYQAAGMPSNGTTVTWPLFRIISAVSDGIMIALVGLVSVLVILIALLCIRFTLLAKIEDDYREIGVMKAIGMRVSEIRRVYLSIYAALAGAGCMSGFLLSLLFQKPLLKGIRLNFGNGGSSATALFLGLVGDFCLFLFLLFYVNRILKRFRNISAAQAIRTGAAHEEPGRTRGFRLSENKAISINLFLGLKDVIIRRRLYLTMLITAILACFILVVPQNLYNTISRSDFVINMGIGACDFRLDIQQTGHIEERVEEIVQDMANAPEIQKYAVFITRLYRMRLDNGAMENIKVELGNHAVFPVQYTEGTLPKSDQDIALSVLYAEELGKQVGDYITLLTGDGEKELMVCGIYSDITNGGKTAKAAFQGGAGEAIFSTICADVENESLLSECISRYEHRFSYAKVSGVDAYIAQTFGQTLDSVRSAGLAAAVAAVAVTLLVTLLFMKLLTTKDRYSIAVLKSLGFTNSDITQQYVWRVCAVMAVGIVFGTALAGTLGERIAGAAIASLGASAFRFQVNPLSAYVLSPAILLLTAAIAAIHGAKNAGRLLISQFIKE